MGQIKEKSPAFNFDKDEILKTDSREDYEKALLQAQQSQFIADKWSKLDQSLYNQSVYYEPNRLSAYYDYESMEFTPEISASLDIYSEESCLAGSTIIPLLDGNEYTIKDIYENDIKNFWVYGVNLRDDKISPSKVDRVIYKGKNDVYKITLDDDSEILCTNNHKWLTIDNNWIDTQELKFGLSLKSIYNKIDQKNILSENNIQKQNIVVHHKSFDKRNNHRVIKIEYIGKEDVYDLYNSSVDSTFGVKCNNGMIISHNCTMSEKGEILTIFSESKRIKNILDDLFINILDVNTNLQMWARGMCKYGDDFVYLKIDPEKGIIGCQQLPNIEIERIEGAASKVPNMSTPGTNPITRELRFAWKNKDLEFQAWEVAHFRILGDDRKLPYGTCLKYNTRIQTDKGYKEIKNISNGDMVWSFDTNNQNRKLSKVLDVVDSGIKRTYKISTKYNYVDVSEEHKILYYDKNTNSFDYKNTPDFKIGDLLVIDPYNNNDNLKPIDKTKPDNDRNGYWSKINLIPDNVTNEFAELFGYLIVNGWINNNAVTIALSVHNSINKKYIGYLEKFSGKKVKLHDGIDNISQGVCNSKMLKDILEQLNFCGKSYEKRLPNWIYSASYDIRKSFLNGIIDSDGSLFIDEWNCFRYNIELSNEELINDIKILVQSLGLKSGKISRRTRRLGNIGERKFKTQKESFYFYFYDSKIKQKNKYEINNRKNSDFIIEPIISIENSGKHKTYDIYVENENHNFYANGIVVHNSMLDKIRRIWKQLLLAEDAMLIYRTSRAPERRVFKVFVGNMDDKDIEPYVQRVANKFKRAPVVDQTNGQVDMRYNQMPVWKNTPIPLLDGRTITIEELSKEYDEGKENWVYSVQDETLQIVPGKVVWCGKNYTAKKLIKIWLDDETWMMTAPEHPFLVFKNEKKNEIINKRADELLTDDSLVPYYVKKSDKIIKGYEMIYNPNSGKYEYVHRLVINEKLKNTGFIHADNKRVIHRINFNKLDNSVENLIEMDRHDHWTLHSSHIEKTINSPERLKEKIKSIKLNHKVSRIEEIFENEDVYCMTVAGINGEDDRHNFAMKSFNIDGTISVSGSFTRNSIDQDYFVPVRDPNQASPIETLPGAQNLGEIADIEYIQKKLLAALRIPKAFLGFEEVVGDGKNLALMDIRFARTINRVQKSLIQELNKIALIHLYLMGMEDELHNFSLSLTNPSAQSDLLRIEQWKEKISLYKDATSDQSQMGILPVSHTWAKKNILGMSDSEVLLDLQQQRLERAIGFELTNSQTIIKRSGVFDIVDKKYGIPEEERQKMQSMGGSPGEPTPGGEGMGGIEPMGAGTTPSAAPTGAEGPLSESRKDKILSMLGESENNDDLFNFEKAQRNIYEIENKINKILND